MGWTAVANGAWALVKWFLVRPWAIAAVALALYCWVLRSDVSELRATLAQAEIDAGMQAAAYAQLEARHSAEAVNAKSAEAANATMRTALVDALAINDRNLELLASHRRRADKAVAELRALRDDMAAQDRAEENARTAIYENDSECGVLRTVRVCPAIAERMRITAQATGPPGT